MEMHGPLPKHPSGSREVKQEFTDWMEEKGVQVIQILIKIPPAHFEEREARF